MVLANGGSLWIDDGRPAPGLLDRTLRNLRDVSATARTAFGGTAGGPER